MAYTPINWQTGDTITAEKLNKCDNGWSVGTTQLFSESITTADSGTGEFIATLAYNTLITAPSLTVTFNGTTYTPPMFLNNAGFHVYGDENYPFTLLSSVDGNIVVTESAGTYSISASMPTAEISDKFNTVLTHSALSPLVYDYTVTTWREVSDALSENRLVVSYNGDGMNFFLSAYSANFSAYSICLDGSGIIVTEYTADNADSLLTYSNTFTVNYTSTGGES